MKWKVGKRGSFSISDWIYCIVIIMFPILYQYAFYFSKVGLIVLAIYSFCVLFLYKRDIIISKSLLIFFSGVTFLQSFTVIKGINSATEYIKATIFAFLMIFCLGCLSRKNMQEKLYTVYKVIGFIWILGIFYQSVQVYILGQLVSPITFLPVLDYTSYMQNYYRPCGFFTEPAAFCTFILPLLSYELVKEKNLLWSIVISLSIILSSSSSGIIIMAFLWSIFILYSGMSLKKKIFFILGVSCLVIMVFNADVLYFVKDKLTNVGTTVSDYTRLTKGMITFWELPFGDKITGIGFNNLTNYMMSTGIRFSWLDIVSLQNVARWQYMSTGFGIFVEYGIIGGILFYILVLRLFRKDDMLANQLVFIYMILTFVSSTLFNSVFLFYLLLYYNGVEKQRRDEFIIIKVRG